MTLICTHPDDAAAWVREHLQAIETSFAVGGGRTVQSEITTALEDELVDVEGAAEILDMTEGALTMTNESASVFDFEGWIY